LTISTFGVVVINGDASAPMEWKAANAEQATRAWDKKPIEVFIELNSDFVKI
jgi:hypothetical protein